VVDVRTAEERAKAGIIDAANQIAIPLEELIAQKANWPADKATPMIIYCGSGHRSTIAMSMLWAYGYSDVKSMQGGFAAYSDAGFPVAEAVAP
jgi:rhodanese-related sulfurtransferase